MAASEAMAPAAQQLQQQKWKDAIPNEQKALQFLLRAEATFRQIQVAFGAQGGGGGGGGGGAARDLAALFDLELDTQKNQYETPQQAATSAEQKAQEIDDALEEARRTGQAPGGSGPAAAQRHADCRAKMAAGDVAARGRATPAADGAAARRRPGQRGSARSARTDQAGNAGRAILWQPVGGSQSGQSRSAVGQARPPTAANKRHNRRSTACAKPTKTCAAPPPRMPARPIPAAQPTACVRPPTCLAACSSRTPPAGSIRWPKQPINWPPAQKQQADHVRDLMAQQNAARDRQASSRPTPRRRKSTRWSTIARR